MFSELYSTFDLYNKLTFFTEECPYFSECFLQGSVSVTGVIIDILKGSDPFAKQEQLSYMYQNLTDSIESTLKYLSDTAPDCPTQTGLSFSWNPMRGHDYYYSKIVDELNLKIGLGEICRRNVSSLRKAAGQTVRCLNINSQKGIVRTRTKRICKDFKR